MAKKPLRVHYALPERLVEPVTARLSATLGRQVVLVPWEQSAADGDVLLIAPHELTERERRAVLSARQWSWVHLTSAGLDFVDTGNWSTAVLLTRSWQCYAAPLAEYAVHAVLSHEWRGQVRWERDEAARPEPAATGLWRARIGVAGWGEVGRRVAAVTNALGASVQVLSRTSKPDERAGITHTTRLADILDADHLVVALPLTPSTRNLLDADALATARAGLHLVNVSRAQIVDQAALYALCAAGRMSATLDVTDPEPLPADHPLRCLPSVRVSNHVAWRSRDSDLAFVDDFAAIWRALASRAAMIPGAVNGQTAGRLARERAAETTTPADGTQPAGNL